MEQVLMRARRRVLLAGTILAGGAVFIGVGVAQVGLAVAQGWNGGYLSFGVGAGTSHFETKAPGAGTVIDDIGGEGVLAEIGGGADTMLGDYLLVGVQANLRFSGIETSLNTAGGGDAELKPDLGADLLGRAGFFVNPRTLVYALGGLSLQRFDVDSNIGGDGSETQLGYVLGAGVETAVSRSMTLRTEYRFHRFNDEKVGIGGTQVTIDPSTHTFFIGMTYRFGDGLAPARAPSADGYRFEGLSLSLGAGQGSVVHDLKDPGGDRINGLGGSGGIVEVGAGFDRMFGPRTFAGVHGDLRYSNGDAGLRVGPDAVGVENDWGLDLYLRGGYVVAPGTAVYALAGYSRQQLDFASNIGISGDKTVHGFVVGGGVETALTRQLALRTEYRFAEYQDEKVPGTTTRIEPSQHTVRAALAYRF